MNIVMGQMVIKYAIERLILISFVNTDENLTTFCRFLVISSPLVSAFRTGMQSE